MALYKNLQQITNDILSRIRVLRPELDTKPGTVTRDIMDPVAEQMALQYRDMRTVSSLQSLLFNTGSDLDNYLSNYGLVRTTTRFSTGTVYLTKSILNQNERVEIGGGEIIETRGGGVQYQVVGSYVMDGINASIHRATALQIQDHLDALGITDEYAIAVRVQAKVAGEEGNKGIYAIRQQSIQGINDCLNIIATTNGMSEESDEDFRKRGILIWLGNDIGSESGYQKTVLNHTSVVDVLVTGPGSIYMTRDGTVVDSSGNIVTEGAGGKVDIWVLGEKLATYIETFAYNDQSGDDDPTSSLNNYRLGQANLVTGDQPRQPVSSISSVIGIIGSEQNTYVEDVNYQLVKDIEQSVSSDEAGSAEGFDRLIWLTDIIIITDEEVTKGVFHSKDGLAHASVIGVDAVKENASILSEDSVGDGTFIITVKHVPISNPTRVYNLTTNETYIVVSYVSSTGKITVTGIKAPQANDFLQVDYIWIHSFDNLTEYIYDEDENAIDWSNDGKLTHSNHPVLMLDSEVLGSFNEFDVIDEVVSLLDGSNWDSADPWVIKTQNDELIDVSIVHNYSTIIVNEKISEGQSAGTQILLVNNEMSNVLGNTLGYYGNSSVEVKTYNVDQSAISVYGLGIEFVLSNYGTNNALATSNKEGSDIGQIAALIALNKTYFDSSVYFYHSGDAGNNTIANGFPWMDEGDATAITAYELRDDTKNYVPNSLINAWLAPNRFNITSRFKIISNTATTIQVVPDSNALMTAVASVGEGSDQNHYLISYVEIAWSDATSPSFYEYMVNYSNGTIKLPSGTTVGANTVVVYKYRVLLTEKGTWTTSEAQALGALEYYIHYNDGKILLGKETLGHTINYKYKHTYDLSNLKTPLLDALLDDDQFRLDEIIEDGITNIVNTATPVDGDVLKVSYTYRIPAATEFGVESPFIIPMNLRIILSGSAMGTGSIVVGGTSAYAIDSEEVTMPDTSYIITVAGPSDVSGGFIGAVLRVYNVTRDIVYDLTSYYIDDATYDSVGAGDGYGSFDQFIGYGDEAYGSEALLNANQLMLNNALNPNSPVAGDKLEIDYIWVKENDTETINFSAFGSQITTKRFWKINSRTDNPVGIQHIGFANEDGVAPTIKIESYNQPGRYKIDEALVQDTIYEVDYEYNSPRENELISVTYVYNAAIGESQALVENARHITANVLVKQAEKVEIDIVADISLDPNYDDVIMQTTISAKLVELLNPQVLSGSLDVSDVITTIGSITGVDSVTISKMVRSDGTGTSKITFGDLEYSYPGIITLNITEAS